MKLVNTKIVEQLSESLARSPCGWTLDEILEGVEAGQLRLWVGENSVAVTGHIAVETVLAAGGDGKDLTKTMQRAADTMRSVGIERLVIENTRKGWFKRLKPFGFKTFNGLYLDL